jgi:ketosteroid isomerase-like protein
VSQENVETFKRAAKAANNRDLGALLKELHPDVEWHPAMSALLGGSETVFQGHDGVRRWFREVTAELPEAEFEFPDIRDLGDRIVALGRLRARGRASGAETESPFAYVVDLKEGRMVHLRAYRDHQEALEAAGLSE